MTITEMAKKWEKYNLDVIVDWQILLIQNSIKSLLCSPDLSDSRSRVSENQSGKGLFNNLTKHLSMDKHWNLYQSLLKQKQLTHTSVNSLMFVENMILLWK